MLSREEACSLRTDYPALTDPSVTAWWGPFCRSLRRVVCISKTAYLCASKLAHCFLCVFHFFQTFARSHDIRVVEGQQDYNTGVRPKLSLKRNARSESKCSGSPADESPVVVSKQEPYGGTQSVSLWDENLRPCRCTSHFGQSVHFDPMRAKKKKKN